MPALRKLSVGIFENDNFDFLRGVPAELESLSLLATRSKKPDLAPLARFRSLQRLFLEGQQKHIEVISELSSLREVTFRSITVEDLALLRSLPNLWSLDIKLGGSKHLDAPAGLENIPETPYCAANLPAGPDGAQRNAAKPPSSRTNN